MSVGAIYKERRLLTSEGKTQKQPEILNLLQAAWLPEEVAVVHCPGHQKGDRAIPRGNWPGGSTPGHHYPNGLAALDGEIHIA